MEKKFRLKDYLGPYRRGMEQLAGDMELARSEGNTVYLFDVPGFLYISGYPESAKMGKRPWFHGRKSFRTAREALKY